MKDPGAEMQKAIHAALMASGDLATAMGGAVRAYDKVVPNPAYPFIRIGDDDAHGIGGSCGDGWEFFATLHIFSRDARAPRMEVKGIANAALSAIANFAALPAPTGCVVRDAELVQSRTFFEDEGVTAHGVATVRYVVRATA